MSTKKVTFEQQLQRLEEIVAALENEGVIERTRTRIRIFDAQRLAQYGLEDTPLAY